MPITFRQIAANTATVTFSYGGEPITIVYYPGRVTEKTIATMTAFSDADQAKIAANFKAFNKVFATLVKSWDVLEDDGKTMFPLDPVRLEELPVFFRVQAMNAILGDFRPEAPTP